MCGKYYNLLVENNGKFYEDNYNNTAEVLPCFRFSSLRAFKSCNADIFLVSLRSSTTFRRSLLRWLTVTGAVCDTFWRCVSLRFASRSFFSISNLITNYLSQHSCITGNTVAKINKINTQHFIKSLTVNLNQTNRWQKKDRYWYTLVKEHVCMRVH